MNGLFVRLHIKCIIIILGSIVLSSPNIEAQYSNKQPAYNSLYYMLKFQNHNSKIEFSPMYHLQYRNLKDFQTYRRDSLLLNPLRFNLGHNSINNYTRKNWFDFSFENTDTLRSSIMYKRPYNLMPNNIKYHYTPSPTTLQGLGILFMGITRTVLFPNAPDYRIEP